MPVNSSLDSQLPKSRTSIRMDAGLDATTRAQVDELAQRFHQPRPAVVCHTMQWGLSRGQAELLDSGGQKALFATYISASTPHCMRKWSRR
jgi:hypothetical protein